MTILKEALGEVAKIEWLWQGITTGVTIAMILAIMAWLRSKWRERVQIRYLCDSIGSCYALMLLALQPGSSESPSNLVHENQRLREIYDETARELEELLDHGTPDLHHKKVIDIRRVQAAMAARFAAAGPHDFEAQHPPWSFYENEFFDWCDDLGWLRLKLDWIRGKVARGDLLGIPTGSRLIIFAGSPAPDFDAGRPPAR